jgi:hypothetical protein
MHLVKKQGGAGHDGHEERAMQHPAPAGFLSLMPRQAAPVVMVHLIAQTTLEVMTNRHPHVRFLRGLRSRCLAGDAQPR